MKLLSKTAAVALVGLFALTAAPQAQAQVNINIAPPSWGPAVPAGAQYYYIPETNGFYDVPTRQYVVQRNGTWVRTTTLSGYNPTTFHPVVVDYVGAQPWVRYEEYKVKYPKKAHPHGMPPGQAKKMSRATVVPGTVYVKDQKHDDKHEGKAHGKGKGKH
jgi:hypothetical protein